MQPKKSASVALAAFLMAPVTHGGEPPLPPNSASDFAVFVTLQRFRIHADQCSDKVPGLKPEFDVQMGRLSSQIQDAAQGLLSSGKFKGMNSRPVPMAISFAFEDMLEDSRRNFERQDAGSICVMKLQKLREMGVETLGHDLTQTLIAVQGMIRNLENPK